MSTEFISAVPIIPARDIEASTSWYRDRLGFTVFHTEDEYGIVRPNAPLEEKPWGFREFAVTDHDGNLVTFFEPPSGYEPQAE